MRQKQPWVATGSVSYLFPEQPFGDPSSERMLIHADEQGRLKIVMSTPAHTIRTPLEDESASSRSPEGT